MEDPEQLIERVRVGDAGAFEQLYERYSRLVYGIAMRVVADPPVAEDVTQGVFLKIWDAPDAFRSGNFTAWISRVARNRALDVLRSRERIGGEVPESIPLLESVEETTFARLDAQAVRSALQDLSAPERQLIELGFFTGLTHQQLALKTGAPLGTVKTRIRSALRKLRTALDGAVRA